jgi:hypothetical protein
VLRWIERTRCFAGEQTRGDGRASAAHGSVAVSRTIKALGGPFTSNGALASSTPSNQVRIWLSDDSGSTSDSTGSGLCCDGFCTTPAHPGGAHGRGQADRRVLPSGTRCSSLFGHAGQTLHSAHLLVYLRFDSVLEVDTLAPFAHVYGLAPTKAKVGVPHMESLQMSLLSAFVMCDLYWTLDDRLLRIQMIP